MTAGAQRTSLEDDFGVPGGENHPKKTVCKTIALTTLPRSNECQDLNLGNWVQDHIIHATLSIHK